MLRKALSIIPLFFIGCFPYVYHDQKRVLVQGIDLRTTLEIARLELEEGGFDATLAVWAIRDQVITEDDARIISGLYFDHIDRIAADKDRTTADFGVWHFTWAIANLYRNGDDSIRKELEAAYRDAQRRPEGLKKFKGIAVEHVSGSKIYMGDIHGLARAFARSHIVAPGNASYLQSLDDYTKKKQKQKARAGAP
ncbi:MAG TPA: hypothetical protein VFP80_18090 [Thermoanaerobaculia bacterium]|nr:hypothetical protein [Thermoanaerobaculia bacterium]